MYIIITNSKLHCPIYFTPIYKLSILSKQYFGQKIVITAINELTSAGMVLYPQFLTLWSWLETSWYQTLYDIWMPIYDVYNVTIKKIVPSVALVTVCNLHVI